MNCKKYQTEIDELGKVNLSAKTLRHLTECSNCHRFSRERERLQQLLQGLEAVNAPPDFNFRVKAQLHGRANVMVNPAWRKLIWIAPTTIAAVVCGFVVIKNSFDADQFRANSNFAVPQIVAVAQPPLAANSANYQTIAPIQTADDEPVKPAAPAIEIAKNNKPKLQASHRAGKNIATPPAIKKADAEKEVIQSRMASVRPERVAILPPGIPNQLQAPKKLDGKQLLLTLGVQTSNDTNGLRVTSISIQAASSGLQTDDVIEKINNENPLSISGSSFQQLNLTVRRNQATQQIKLTAKP